MGTVQNGGGGISVKIKIVYISNESSRGACGLPNCLPAETEIERLSIGGAWGLPNCIPPAPEQPLLSTTRDQWWCLLPVATYLVRLRTND